MQINIRDDLYVRVAEYAKRLGLSVEEFVEVVLERVVGGGGRPLSPGEEAELRERLRALGYA